jgi:dimeric dUTPase (all-alpha-NTP-PPase superfamily)
MPQPITKQLCYKAHAKHCTNCNKKTCKYWLSHPNSQNCVLIEAAKGPHTLQEIGDIYDLTRMRICQIEKVVREKIKKLFSDQSSFDVY